MHAEIKDPDDKIVLSRIYSAEGEFPKLLTNLVVSEWWNYHICLLPYE